MFRPALFALACVSATPASAEERYALTTGQVVGPLETFQECAACPEMIVLPQGSFLMGAVEGESDNTWRLFGPDAPGGQWGPDETIIIPAEHPRHPVEIDIPFAMGRNEVTIGEWMRCVDAGACTAVPAMEAFTVQPGRYETTYNGVYIPMGPDHPATDISFLDMQDYVAWLNAEVGAEVYRLPTEAEWEYAARAGTQTRFAHGDFITPEQANYHWMLTARMLGLEEDAFATHQMPLSVHELDAANAWGLRHMSGNVREMTISRYTDSHLGFATSRGYLEHALADLTERRVGKGGSFNGAMDYSRLAFRFAPSTDFRYPATGLRILREM